MITTGRITTNAPHLVLSGGGGLTYASHGKVLRSASFFPPNAGAWHCHYSLGATWSVGVSLASDGS